LGCGKGYGPLFAPVPWIDGLEMLRLRSSNIIDHEIVRVRACYHMPV